MVLIQHLNKISVEEVSKFTQSKMIEFSPALLDSDVLSYWQGDENTRRRFYRSMCRICPTIAERDDGTILTKEIMNFYTDGKPLSLFSHIGPRTLAIMASSIMDAWKINEAFTRKECEEMSGLIRVCEIVAGDRQNRMKKIFVEEREKLIAERKAGSETAEEKAEENTVQEKTTDTDEEEEK